MERYQLETFVLPAALEDELVAELWVRGALGCEVKGAGEAGRVRVEAWFPSPPPPVRAGFDLEAWTRRGVVHEATADEPARDWLAEHRAAARPFELGRGFRVDPRDVEPRDVEPRDVDPQPGGRRLLRIPAQTAFGTGSHESTRLVVEWLEALDPRGLSVLDVGTGSGILAFVAELLGAARVVGYDPDPSAPVVARANARANGCAPALVAAGVGALRPVPRFDLALVNVLPERVLGDYPRLVRLLRPGARVVSSGNLVERRDELLTRLTAHGLALRGEKRYGEWLALLFEVAR